MRIELSAPPGVTLSPNDKRHLKDLNRIIATPIGAKVLLGKRSFPPGTRRNMKKEVEAIRAKWRMWKRGWVIQPQYGK